MFLIVLTIRDMPILLDFRCFPSCLKFRLCCLFVWQSQWIGRRTLNVFHLPTNWLHTNENPVRSSFLISNVLWAEETVASESCDEASDLVSSRAQFFYKDDWVRFETWVRLKQYSLFCGPFSRTKQIQKVTTIFTQITQGEKKLSSWVKIHSQYFVNLLSFTEWSHKRDCCPSLTQDSNLS